MVESNFGFGHTYTLVLTDGGRRGERALEFRASGADAALLQARKACEGREFELFENGRSLGRLRMEDEGGFWSLNPPSSQRGYAEVSQPKPKAASVRPLNRAKLLGVS